MDLTTQVKGGEKGGGGVMDRSQGRGRRSGRVCVARRARVACSVSRVSGPPMCIPTLVQRCAVRPHRNRDRHAAQIRKLEKKKEGYVTDFIGVEGC
jgi:hypothetical protein